MKIKHLFACTLGLLLAASCSNETPVGDSSDSLFGDVPEGMFEYRFTIQGITPTRLSYATVAMEEAEMKLHNAKVLVFGQTAAGSLAATDKLVCVKDAEIVKGKSRFMIDKDTKFPTDAKAVAVLQIANIENSNLEALTLTGGTTTYKDVMDKLESKGDAGANIENVGLLQIGRVLDCALPVNGKLAVGKMTIKRPFARFDVRNSGMKALTITKLEVKDISNKFLVLTDDKFPADAVHNHKKEVVVPKGLNRPEDGSKPDAEMLAKFVPGVLYSYPGSVAGADSPVLLVTGKLVTGAGKEKELKDYEVPFAKGDTKLRIKTNTRYTLTLKAELDGIVVDISESFAEWGSEEDAAITYEPDLDAYKGVVSVGEGLTLETVKSDGTPVYQGAAGKSSYHFTVAGEKQDDLTAILDGVSEPTDAKLTVKSVESYAVSHYEIVLNDFAKYTSKEFTIIVAGTGVKMEIKHTGDESLKPAEPTIEEYPVAEGKTISAVKVGNLWWAPVNVGATTTSEIGSVFQYGRNTGWTLANAYGKAKEEYFPLEKLEAIEDVPYIGPSAATNPEYWFDTSEEHPGGMETFNKDIASKWAAVSDGTNNPCPTGWRIPTKAELEVVIAGKADFKATPLTLTFENGGVLSMPYAGHLSPNKPLAPGSMKTTVGIFWTVFSGSIDKAAIAFTQAEITQNTTLSLAACCNLRCVKDAK